MPIGVTERILMFVMFDCNAEESCYKVSVKKMKTKFSFLGEKGKR